MNAPFPKHEAHIDGGFAPWHTVAIIPMQAVLLFRVPDMHAAHKGLAEVAGRLGVGHELALGAHVWYPGSEGEPQQTLIDKSQLKKAPQLLLLLLLLPPPPPPPPLLLPPPQPLLVQVPVPSLA